MGIWKIDNCISNLKQSIKVYRNTQQRQTTALEKKLAYLLISHISLHAWFCVCQSTIANWSFQLLIMNSKRNTIFHHSQCIEKMERKGKNREEPMPVCIQMRIDWKMNVFIGFLTFNSIVLLHTNRQFVQIVHSYTSFPSLPSCQLMQSQYISISSKFPAHTKFIIRTRYREHEK